MKRFGRSPERIVLRSFIGANGVNMGLTSSKQGGHRRSKIFNELIKGASVSFESSGYGFRCRNIYMYLMPYFCNLKFCDFGN